MSPHDAAAAAPSGSEPPLVISVRSATGTGQTPLSAFDDALHDAGVGDLNLIALSSVVPPSAEIRRGDTGPLPATHGDRLYCVLSVAHAELRGASAWAGIGWTHAGEAGGYFVEHHGGSRESVEELIRLTLTDMAERRGIPLGEIHQEIVGVHCDDLPVCAVVVAAYEARGWGAAW